MVQRLTVARPVSRLLARGLRPADRWLLRLTGDRLTLTTLLTSLRVVVLNTRGAQQPAAQRTARAAAGWRGSRAGRFSLRE